MIYTAATRVKRNAYCKEWRKANPDKTKAAYCDSRYGNGAHVHLQNQLSKQSHCCAICSTVLTEPCLDHNHETGQWRGALCHQCNLALGHIKDNQETLLKAVEYLKFWKEQV
jgi:hypothetical protein